MSGKEVNERKINNGCFLISLQCLKNCITKLRISYFKGNLNSVKYCFQQLKSKKVN